MCQVHATLKASQAEDSEWHGAAPPWLGVGCKRYQWANLTTYGLGRGAALFGVGHHKLGLAHSAP